MNYIRVGHVEDFPVNSCHVVDVAQGEPVVVINLEGNFYVLEGRCSHSGHTLKQITIIESEGRVLCPWHGWEMDVERGICTAIPDCTLKVFPVRLEKDEVLIVRN